MNRQEKIEVVKDLTSCFKSSNGSFVINYQGLAVADLQGLKKKLRIHGAKVKVAKARLMKLAAQEVSGFNELDKFFKDQIALVFVDNDSSAVAKVLCDSAKENENLNVIAGCVEERCLDFEGVKFLATLPSREILLTQLAAQLSSPAKQLACLLHNVLAQFVLVLKAIEKKKQQ